jgi:hypothetical protein
LPIPISREITIDAQVMPFKEVGGKIFFKTHPVLSFLHLWSTCKTKGYDKLNSRLSHLNFKLDTVFLWSLGGKIRTHISLEAVLALTKNDELKTQISHLVQSSLQGVPIKLTAPTTSDKNVNVPTTVPIADLGVVLLNGVVIVHRIIENCVFFCGIDFMTAAGYANHYRDHKWTHVNKHLAKRGYDLEECVKGGFKIDIYVSYDAALCILEMPRLKTRYCVRTMKTDIIENLSRLASANHTACPRTLDEYFSKKTQGQVVEEIAGMFNTAIKRNPTLSGALGESDLQSIIQLVRKENPAFGRNTVKELFGEMYPITTRELINIEENYSGVRLIRRLRKFIPTVPPYTVINKE